MTGVELFSFHNHIKKQLQGSRYRQRASSEIIYAQRCQIVQQAAGHDTAHKKASETEHLALIDDERSKNALITRQPGGFRTLNSHL